MNLYRLYTRQTKPEDNQYYAMYYVYAQNALEAEVAFLKRHKHAYITLSSVVDHEEPIILLATGWDTE
jgi:hypothetical protein